MNINSQEIRKNPEGVAFERILDLSDSLKERNQEILGVKDIVVKGKAQYEDNLYFLDYDLSYTILLASSRSMEPVELKENYPVHEVFMEVTTAEEAALAEDDLVLPLEDGAIDVAESVADNILLNIPLKVLTPEEEAGGDLPSGQNWQLLSQEAYAAQQEESKKENNPFAGLAGLFDE